MENKINKDKNNLKLIYILLVIAFIVPSLVYLIKGKSILKLQSSCSFFYGYPTDILSKDKILSTMMFVIIVLGLSVTYFIILKNHKKIFKTKEDIAKFILIVAVLFFIMLPLTSTDVFYYIATGWSEAEYGVNPYYTSVHELSQMEEYVDIVKSDQILLKMPGVWSNTTIVYGPLWPFICKILSGISMGNLAFALFIYKLFNLCIHLLNCYLIYKLTNKKKLFTLMYGLNPMVLFEGLCNVHNDILVVCLVLIALYFFIKKKNVLLTVVFFALATAVKYYAILLVPFIIIYHYRKEKVLKRILYSCGWAIIFIVVIILCYLLYMKDFEVLKGIFVQQNKYTGSIFLVIALSTNTHNASRVSKGFMLAFVIIYCYNIIKLLFTKKISFTTNIRKYNSLLLLFIFGTITNFNSWYTMWLLPTMMWQKGKTIKNILNITISSQLAYSVFFLFNESYIYGKYFYILMILLITLPIIGEKIYKKTREMKSWQE